MEELLDQFRARLSDLQERGRDLSAKLRSISHDLTTSGGPPPEMIVEELRSFRIAFRELRAQLQAGSDANGNTLGSLAEIGNHINERSSVRHALSLLDRLAAIRVEDSRDLAGWQRCLNDGYAMRQQLAGGSSPATVAQAKQLLSTSHPLAAVMRLVSEGDFLTDEDWWALHDVVVSAYGRELSTAIVRRRLSISPAA